MCSNLQSYTGDPDFDMIWYRARNALLTEIRHSLLPAQSCLTVFALSATICNDRVGDASTLAWYFNSECKDHMEDVAIDSSRVWTPCSNLPKGDLTCWVQMADELSCPQGFTTPGRQQQTRGSGSKSWSAINAWRRVQGICMTDSNRDNGFGAESCSLEGTTHASCRWHSASWYSGMFKH